MQYLEKRLINILPDETKSFKSVKGSVQVLYLDGILFHLHIYHIICNNIIILDALKDKKNTYSDIK